MEDRNTTERAPERVAPEALNAVRGAVLERNGAMTLAMAFDPGTVSDIALHVHALDIVMGLLYVRGWRRVKHKVRVVNARDWAERWWDDTLGPGAFVVETALHPDARCAVDDIETVIGAAALAWCMERDACRSECPTPDLLMAAVFEGVSLASIHHERWDDAVRGSLGGVDAYMSARAQGVLGRSHTWVRMHLEGSSVEPWSLPGRSCVFATAVAEPDCRRTFVALRDTADTPNPETTCNLLRLMLASGAN